MVCNSFKRSCQGKYKKSSQTEIILGCPLDTFICHLQFQFKPNMTLENHGQGPGKWNMDHIIPISDGGNNCQVNLVVCCKDCNNERGNMDFKTYISIKKKNLKGKLFI